MILPTCCQEGNTSINYLKHRLYRILQVPVLPAIATFGVVSADKSDGLLLGFERTFQLGVLHGCQNPLKSGSWLKTHSHEIVTVDQSRWPNLLRRSGRKEV